GMAGMFGLTTEVDQVANALFDETGLYVASFVIDDQVIGEIEVPVYVQSEPPKLEKDVEDGLKKSDVIWVGARVGGKLQTVPAWFAYKNGRIYVLSQPEPGPAEQTSRGVGTAKEFVVITRRKLRDTALNELTASGRVLDGPAWEDAAKVLADRPRCATAP